ncbi:hypothetical protein BC793_108216 [Actinoplanes xinjiangensis]|uniref:Uncharacterized protein n=1 Tax=Actinoplanes xinjiangensis TaxID=512350 RepID=A0A316FDY3_9ACTN|nr:hypothetical protein [Actinoplanes xinjiangensis]PWK47101.1 hypothetical protein BC793_108216 [Actinoplanes xinjiangensis]
MVISVACGNGRIHAPNVYRKPVTPAVPSGSGTTDSDRSRACTNM